MRSFSSSSLQRGSATKKFIGFTSYGIRKADPLTMEMIEVRKELFKIVGLVGTFEILSRIKEEERCSYGDLPNTTSIASRNMRLIQLKNLKLITHHFERGKEKRIEWYEITEKGIKFLSILEQLDHLDDDLTFLQSII